MLEIGAILYNWTTNDRMDAGSSLNNRPKRVDNMTGSQQTIKLVPRS